WQWLRAICLEKTKPWTRKSARRTAGILRGELALRDWRKTWGWPAWDQVQRAGHGRKRALLVGAQCGQFPTRLVHGPRRHLDLGRLEIHQQFWLPCLPELWPQLRRRAR